jgi:putative serine protease PepD
MRPPGSPSFIPPRPSGPAPATASFATVPVPASTPPGYAGPAGPYAPAGPHGPAGPAGPHGPAAPASISGPPVGTHPRRAGRRGGALGIIGFVLSVLLLGLAGAQAYLLVTLDRELTETNRSAAAEQKKDADRMAALEGRIKELERRTGNTLDAQAVAADVVPSVFRVTAGEFSGTAFAVGKEADGGGTNLLTNFHVVEDLYRSGGREVVLEHTNARFPARIVRVDEANDLALLQSEEKFPRLVAASEPVKAGQPVVVVGAPLGLSDTITTGVVSAVRNTPDGPVLQFDAPINPGNSGGPVINAQRQVVGIATAKARNAEGIGLAIPIQVACDSLKVC